MKGQLRGAVVLTAAAALITSCTGDVVDKSGGQKVHTLVMANNDGGLDGAPAVAHFIDRVKELSGSTVTITVKSHWQGGGDERRVITDVASGKADLGWAGTRAFDTAGVEAFQPLHAPFLISSYTAQTAVVRNQAAQDLLTRLRPIGLDGLVLLADELRRPAAVAKPLLTPTDFRDLRFGTPASKVQESGLRALGAQPVTFRTPHPPDTNGLDALDTMWWTYRANNQADFVPFVTGNVALWPRTTVVFANSQRLKALDARTRGWLSKAATETKEWSATHAGEREAAEVAEACLGGARIATVTDAQVAALRTAAAPAYAALRKDRDTSLMLTRIQALVAARKAEAPVPVPTGCAYQPGDENRTPVVVPALEGPGRPGRIPQGTYRYVITMGDIRGTGMPDEFARANAGVWTWTIGSGIWSYKLQYSSKDVPAGYGGNTCAGYFDATGDRVSFTRITEYPKGDCAPPTWAGRWTTTKAGLKWHLPKEVGRDLIVPFSEKVWERIS